LVSNLAAAYQTADHMEEARIRDAQPLIRSDLHQQRADWMIDGGASDFQEDF
jgi:hypothetical protein